MSMFKKLKGLFVLEEESGKTTAAESSSSQENTPIVAAEQSQTVDDVAPSDTVSRTKKISGKPDDKFVDILLKAVEKNNMEGFDYLEFKSSLQSLAGMSMDDATRYKSAMAMAKTMGATPDKLIASANHYLKVLKSENTKFQTALKNQRTKQVTGREGDIKATQTSIADKKKQIAQLEKGILADEKKLEKLKAGINQAAAKVQSTGDSFALAYQVVVGQIQSDVDNMKSHLK